MEGNAESANGLRKVSEVEEIPLALATHYVLQTESEAAASGRLAAGPWGWVGQDYGTKRVIVDKEEFSLLHARCVASLNLYVEKAKETGRMLRQCEGRPLTAVVRAKLQLQRTKEDEAHERYRDIRARLFAAADVDP